jgi:hypothetical protein
MKNRDLPAFPLAAGADGINEGQTLRDYFAAKAMQGIVSTIDGESNYQRLKDIAEINGLTVSQWIARDSYKQADAMLWAREL